MTRLGIAGIVTGLIVAMFALPFVFGWWDVQLFKFLEPRKEDARREVFENTKSYLQGIQQDLGKYYHEYQDADPDEQAAIRATIRMRFAEVDETKLQNQAVADWLVRMRGY